VSVELTGVVPRAGVRERAAAAAGRVPAPAWLGLLVVAITALDVWWRTLETRPPHWDMGHHLSNSLVYLHGPLLSDPLRYLEGYLFYPPLVYWVTDVFYAVLGTEAMWVAILSNAVWIGILAFATYGLGRRLWSPRCGWLSVAFVVTAPMIVSASKEYMLDLPLTAMAALALYLLVRSDGFASRRFSLLFGLACGAGLLVKWTLPLVLALPLLHATAAALADARQNRRFERLAHLAGAAALTFGVCGLWYVHNFTKILGGAVAYGAKGVDQTKMPPVTSLTSATWYLENLVSRQLYLVPVLFVAAGVVFSFRKRELAARNVYPILMVVGTLVAFTLLQHKDGRYTLPMLPALAVIATSWVEYVSTRARRWAAMLLVAYGALAFLVISFGSSLLPSSVSVGRVVLFAQHGYIVGPPTDEDWHQAEAMKAVAGSPASERTFAYEGPDTIWFNEHGLNYYALRYGATWAKEGEARFLLDRRPAHATPAGYEPLRRWRLPDGTTLVLYERG
jgi:4-amino-4-deoxy-L-arabinose transferase-like glycosyltransferase